MLPRPFDALGPRAGPGPQPETRTGLTSCSEWRQAFRGLGRGISHLVDGGRDGLVVRRRVWLSWKRSNHTVTPLVVDLTVEERANQRQETQISELSRGD